MDRLDTFNGWHFGKQPDTHTAFINNNIIIALYFRRNDTSVKRKKTSDSSTFSSDRSNITTAMNDAIRLQ